MLTKIKKRSALLVILAVACATVAIVPQGAVAQSKGPNTGVGADVYTAPTALSHMTACPGDSASAAGFTDTTSTDVDCIKMYGITQGTTATTYEPDGTIPRWQMALFIHRMFVPTGVAAAGLTAVPAFTDTSGLSAEIQAAITALASHGITLGTSTTTFGPNDNVTREQMALFLNRFADIALTSAGAAITTNIADGSFNYSDLGTATFEGLEAIARLYNLGVTEGACVGGTQYVTAGTCSTTYRPNDAITRAEMATMVNRLLGHTNARPAGVSIQTTTSTAALDSEATLISVRNDDFTPSVSTLVDEFYQVHMDLLTAQAPFHSVLGTCTAANVSNTGGTLCLIDNGDKVTNALGNVAGTAQTTLASSTANWWVWTGDSGAQYVDGTTAGVFKFSLVNGAAAAGIVYADTTTYTSNKTTAKAETAAGLTGITANDGTSVIAGDSITFTATMSKASLTAAGTAHTVVDGYTFKFVDHSVDHLGNVTNTTTYVPSSGGTASYTVTCPADDSTANTTYFKGHEITVTMAAADGGTGIPANASPGNPLATPVGLMNNSTLNVTCDDQPRAYTDTAGIGNGTLETLVVNSNNFVVATAGSLASITATAYDQYGDGKDGVTVQFQKDGADAALLTTGADGTATLTTVVCTANGTEAWSVNTNNGVMATVVATTPTAATEGTTIYCAQNATDTTPQAGSTAVTYSNVTGVNTVYTITADAGDAASGEVTCTINGVVANAFDFEASDAESQNALNAASTSNGAASVYAAGAPEVWTVTNDGGASLPTCVSTLKMGNGTALGVTIAATTAGTIATTMDFIDNDAASDSFIAVLTEKNHGVVHTTYLKFTYDSTDYFRTAADPAIAEAAFEAALAAVGNTTTDMTIAWRTGALTSGISAISLG